MSDVRVSFMMAGWELAKKNLLDDQAREEEALSAKHIAQRRELDDALELIQSDCPHDHVVDNGYENYHNNTWDENITCKICHKSSLPKSFLK